MNQRSGFGFWLITSPKVATESKFKHYHNPLIKPRQIMYFLFGIGQSQGQLYPSIWELIVNTMAPLSTLSQFDRKLLAKDADGPKGRLGHSMSTGTTKISTLCDFAKTWYP